VARGPRWGLALPLGGGRVRPDPCQCASSSRSLSLVRTSGSTSSHKRRAQRKPPPPRPKTQHDTRTTPSKSRRWNRQERTRHLITPSLDVARRTVKSPVAPCPPSRLPWSGLCSALSISIRPDLHVVRGMCVLCCPASRRDVDDSHARHDTSRSDIGTRHTGPDGHRTAPQPVSGHHLQPMVLCPCRGVSPRLLLCAALLQSSLAFARASLHGAQMRAGRHHVHALGRRAA
jgi:hypothetical protein